MSRFNVNPSAPFELADVLAVFAPPAFVPQEELLSRVSPVVRTIRHTAPVVGLTRRTAPVVRLITNKVETS